MLTLSVFYLHHPFSVLWMVPLIEDIRLTIKKPDQRSAPRDDKRAWPQSLALVAVQSLPKLMMSAWKLWAVHHSKPKEQPQRSTIKKPTLESRLWTRLLSSLDIFSSSFAVFSFLMNVSSLGVSLKERKGNDTP